MLNIIHQQNHLIIIDKPPGVLVHSHPLFPDEYPLLQRLRDQIGQMVWPVHRLDRQTSGCLMFTTEKAQIEPLAEALRQGHKTYWAFVRGAFPHQNVVMVDTPIQGKEAFSEVRCLGRGTTPRCSLLEVKPKTGRNHQVRRHVRDLHHPILHDGDHGDSRVNRWWREHMGLSRLALHAGVLSIEIDTQPMVIKSPLPQDLQDTFQQLPWWDSTIEQHPDLIKPKTVHFC